MSGLARDALNPVAIFNVVRGLGPWYLLLVLFVSGCALLGVLLVRHLELGMVLFASGQLLVLLVYAAIGGVMYQRRLELGFDPIVSPERKATWKTRSASNGASSSSTGYTRIFACVKPDAPPPVSPTGLRKHAAARGGRGRAGHPRRGNRLEPAAA